MICLWWHYIGKSISNIFWEKYNSIYKVSDAADYTTCVFSHTFCSNMAKSRNESEDASVYYGTLGYLVFQMKMLYFMLNFRMHRKIFKKQSIGDMT